MLYTILIAVLGALSQHALGLLLWIYSGSNPQVYFVTKVQGLVMQAETQKALKTGSRISEQDKLIFKTEDALIYAVNAYGSVYKSKDVKVGEIQQVISVLFPSKGQAATKNFLLPGKKQLQQFWAANDTLKPDGEAYVAKPFVIFSPMYYKVMAKEYKPSSDRYFFVKFRLKGREIKQMIDFKSDTLILDRTGFQEIESVEEENSVEEMQLFFGNMVSEAVFLSDFKPLFIKDDWIMEEISIMLKYKDSSKSTQKWVNYDLIPYLQEVYGYIYEPNLRQWLRDKLNLEY